jgi:hypothetical protein
MMAIMLVGIAIVGLSVAINIMQIQPFVHGMAYINETTFGFWDRMCYPFRVIRILPKLIGPLLPDILIVGAGGVVGFGAGLIGGIISMAASCMVSMAFKLSMHLAKKRRLAHG